MSTQQDIHAAGLENRHLCLTKTTMRMIPEPGDPDHEVHVAETFHEQTDEELTEKEKKAKLFNEWEMFTSIDGESIESYYHRFSKLINDFKRNKHFPEKIASNLKFLNTLQPEWSRHVDIVHQIKDLHEVDYTQLTTMSMELVLIAKAFKLNYSTPTNNNQRISSNPRNRQIAQLGINLGQDRQMQMVGAAASTLGTQTDKAPVYDSDGSAEFLGMVRFENDHIAAILGYGDLQWGNILITMVYFVEGLGHNLFSVGNRTTNLYTINILEMASTSPICLMARATSTKYWLWHQRLSHLNFDTINDLANNDLVIGLPKFKYHKEHLCPSCDRGKSKKASHPPKPVPNSKQRLHLLHMDFCGPIRVESINGKRYVLVIVDDYSRYTWVHFLRSKDEAPEEIKTFLKKITVFLQAPVIIVRTDNVMEQRHRMLVEAARIMLIFSRAPLFLWAEAIATACYTQNRSIIHRRFDKTPYELIKGRKLDISFLHVFGALCYPKNDRKDIRKLCAKSDIGLELTYAPSTITTQQPTERELDLLFEAMYDDYIGGQPSAATRTALAA
ncbi:retrovirus-related pol polyprotein from transposon TNT 1-94 [Tanacetum coccineum]